MKDELIWRPLTDEDKLILEYIRSNCINGNPPITMKQWESILKSHSAKYVKEILEYHQHDLKTIHIIGQNHYQLTLHGVFLLDGVYLMLFKLVCKMPYIV